MIVWIVTLESWKGPGYTRRNIPFAIGVVGGPQARGKTIAHPLEVEDTVSTSREETQSQLDELEYEESIEEVEDNFDAYPPVPTETTPYQSVFSLDCEDMASPYGSGGEWGVRRFSGATGTIEVEDFKREFTIWCELQKSRNPNFNPYMVWRALFRCL